MRATPKYLFVPLLSLFVLGAGAGKASAQELGDAHHFTISAERMFGFTHTSSSINGTSRSQDQFSLLGNPLGGFTGYSWPRVALDFFVAPNLSLGGSVGIFHLAPSGGSLTGFLLAPRVGYALHLAGTVLFWPRAGLTYEHISTDAGTGGLNVSSTASALALTVEAPLVFLLPPRVAFTLGPTIDVGLTGSTSSGGTSIDTKSTDFGIHAGLLVYL